jgi:hypothetical protein
VRAIQVRFFGLALALIGFAAGASAIDETQMNNLHKKMYGCWFFTANPGDKIQLGELLCLRPNGLASGFYFDVIWGTAPYTLEGDRLHVKPWVEARIIEVAENKIVLERDHGEIWSYRIICRTEPEDEKCKKLDLHDPWSIAAVLSGN